MEPTRQLEVTLTDVLDRLLDKGLVLNADVIISVAGIPLIGLTLRAALAGMETMLAYGVMKDWDQATRAWENEHRVKKVELLLEGEKQILKMFGSYWYSEGIYMAWRSGWLYLTDKRLFLYQQDFAETIFQFPLENLKGMVIKSIKSEFHKEGKDVTIMHMGKEDRIEVEALYLIPKQGRVIQLKAQDVHQLKQEIEKQAKEMGLTLEKAPSLEEVEDRAVDLLEDGEKITHRSRMWYLVKDKSVLGDMWKPGHLYFTNKRLCWWYESEHRLLFEVPIGKINASVVEVRDLSKVLTHKQVFDVIYTNNGSKKVASFSGKETKEWQAALNKVIVRQSSGKIEEEKETCPRCKKQALVSELLKRGCLNCGWVSPSLKKERLKKEVAKILKA